MYQKFGGSVVGLSDESGAMAERYRYDVFGQTEIVGPGQRQLTKSRLGNTYLFTARQHGLNERQRKAILYMLSNGRVTLCEYEVLCSDIRKRTLQGDLKLIVKAGLVRSEGATNKLVYIWNK